jgi:PAS domain S-box-containing protein
MREQLDAFVHLMRDRLILIGVFLGALFWLIESGIHLIFSPGPSFFQEVFFPEWHEVWMRLVVVTMFILFGIYGQWLISARKRAQDAFRLAATELTQIFETSADGMRVIDNNFSVLRANQTFCDLAGLSKEEVTGRKCYEVLRGPLCHTEECPLSRILNGEDRVECDSEKVAADGQRIPCIVTATPFRNPSGELIGIVEDFKDISERKRTEEALRRSRRRMRELASYLESAREKERTRVAREIHDELGQSLTALKMELHWCIKRLPEHDELLAERARAISDLVDMTVHLVQRISSELRPGLLDNLGLSAAIEWQANQFQDRTGIPCNFTSEPDEIVLDQTLSTAIFRVCQEALTNIARHANATNAQIRLNRTPDAVELKVSDNGRGITEKEISDSKSFGIMGMRERVHSLGGILEIGGAENSGTTVRVRVPANGGESLTGA